MQPSPVPLALPSAVPERRRGSLPLYAAFAPIAGGVVLWVATGSVLSLWLAALAPLMLAASALDARRSARHERRRAREEHAAARARAVERIAEQHAAERARLRDRHRDVAGYLRPDAPVWRGSGTLDALVVGQGPRPSALVVTGGDGDDEALALRERAGVLEAAPVLVPARAGVAVVGPPGLARAVVRALVAQLALALPPTELHVAAGSSVEHPWLAGLPHARIRGRSVLALADPGGIVWEEADVVIARVATDAPLPPRCRIVLMLVAPAEAELESDGERRRIAIEGIGASQADAIARSLSSRQSAVVPPAEGDAAVLLSALRETGGEDAGGLRATLGVTGGRPFSLDLVSDGPHAVVIGVTGSGKSELLITWITALCLARTPREVVFLLVDFKGGTAFRALEELPHVTGVLTDLDADGARRAIESLRAELRVREAALARVGARDVSDPRADVPRLVIVVDEFAALVERHPDLPALFSDIAARGRGLGMHLVLGTQRATGVLRDALLANCPLRIGLRVTDPEDSRALLGTDAAARLPGGPGTGGWALVRGAADPSTAGATGAPGVTRVRVALTRRVDIERAIRAAGHEEPVRRPWLPPLPDRVPLREIEGAGAAGDIVLGVADEPDRQRRVPVLLRTGERGLLVLGTSGSGKSSALALVAAQCAGRVHGVGPDLERAWDEVDSLADRPAAAGDVVLVDDLDGLVLRYPPEYAQAFLERLELVVRAVGGGGARVVITAQRLGGALARLGDLFPRRALLRMATRADFLAAGGDPASRAGGPPGRAHLDGRTMQFAVAEPPEAPSAAPALTGWEAGDGVVGLVLRPGAVARRRAEGLARRGLRVVPVESAGDLRAAGRGPHEDASAPRGGAGEHRDGAGVAVVGGPDAWQREWRTLATIREHHDLLIDAACAGEYRLVSGDRSLPPYCAPGASRAWLLRRGAAPVRAVLPEAA